MRIGETFPGRQVARIVESRNKDFSKGRVNQMKLYFLMSGQIGSCYNFLKLVSVIKLNHVYFQIDFR